jgi:ribonuclease HI
MWTIAHAECIYLPQATINVAEYKGLLYGLQHAVKLGIQELFVSGDSQIVLTQVTGR